MLRSVFGKAMWDRRVSLIWWLVGVTVLMTWIVAFFPALRDSPELQDFIDQFPPEALALFGIDPATYQTGFGYLQAQLYSFMAPLLLIAFTATAGGGATAGEEETGTIDPLLAIPISRTRVVLEKFGALTVQAATIVTLMVLVLLVANPLLDLKLSTRGVLGINLGLLLLGLVFGALAMAIGAWRGKRALAAGVVVGAGLITFLINGFAPLVEGLEGLQKLTPFFWYLDGDPLLNGPRLLHLVLAVVVLGLLAIAVVLFRRADLGARRPVFTFSLPSRSRRPQPARPRSGPPTSLYHKMLWDRRKSFWWWLLAIGGTAAFTIAFWPTIDSGGDAMQGMMEAIPSELLAMFGITDAAALLTAEGFLSARLYSSLGTTLMLVFTIAAGTGAIAGEEATGTMDLLIGLPVRRNRVVTDRAAGLVTLVALLMVGLTVVVVVGGALVDMGLSPARVAAANVGLGLLALFFGTMALALGGWTGKAGVATGIAAAVAVAGFLLNGLGAAVDGLEPFRLLSPFYWYLQDSPPLARGLTNSYLLMLAGVVVFTSMTLPGFRRRDIAT
jgi:ABC-2 type transport system permease protein